jgi:hypothetical protein
VEVRVLSSALLKANFRKALREPDREGHGMKASQGFPAMSRRSVGPWFRTSKNAWYVCHEGKQVSLGVKGEESKAQAIKAWHRLMGGVPLVQPEPLAKPKPTAVPCPDTVPVQRHGLTALVKAFLADAQARVKPESYRGYAKFLNPFADAFANTAPDKLTASAVERFSKQPEWSQSYRCGFIGTVVSLFRWAKDRGRTSLNCSG